MSTMYDNERAYCFLSDAEKAELDAAQKAGRVMILLGFAIFKKRHNLAGPFHEASVYRIAKPAPKKPSIDWSHVADWLNFIAMDSDGHPHFYEWEPKLGAIAWYGGGRSYSAISHPSFRPGTCHWRDSLVMRPGVEE